jgi:hypothetical protein
VVDEEIRAALTDLGQNPPNIEDIDLDSGDSNVGLRRSRKSR